MKVLKTFVFLIVFCCRPQKNGLFVEGDYQSYNKLTFRVLAVNVQGLLTKSTITHHNNMKHSGKGKEIILLQSVL